jgi:hypothetical protein
VSPWLSPSSFSSPHATLKRIEQVKVGRRNFVRDFMRAIG